MVHPPVRPLGGSLDSLFVLCAAGARLMFAGEVSFSLVCCQPRRRSLLLESQMRFPLDARLSSTASRFSFKEPVFRLGPLYQAKCHVSYPSILAGVGGLSLISSTRSSSLFCFIFLPSASHLRPVNTSVNTSNNRQHKDCASFNMLCAQSATGHYLFLPYPRQILPYLPQ